MELLTGKEVNDVILTARNETGNISAALRTAGTRILSSIDENPARGDIIDVFPADRLHSATGRLCRCRGMIQEVNPEPCLFRASTPFFLGPEIDTRAAHSDDGLDTDELVDAMLLYVIPVPGNTHFYQGPSSPASDMAIGGGTGNAGDGPRPCRKRPGTAEEEEAGEEAEETPSRGPHGDAEGHYLPDMSCRRAKGEAVKEGVDASGVSTPVAEGNGTAAPFPTTIEERLNHPHPQAAEGLQSSCIVTVLLPREDKDDDCARTTLRQGLRTNAVIDFYGFLHSPDDQTPAAVLEEDELAQFSSWHVAELTRGLVSRLLCLAWRPVFAPLQAAPSSDHLMQARRGAVAHLREHVCHGDHLVAEYLLLHLCGFVSAHSSVTPIGDVPLLVCGTDVQPAAWSQALSRVVPVAELLINRERLAGAADRLFPQQDSKRNYLRTGIFQLGNGTHITVDCLSQSHSTTIASPSSVGTTAGWPEALFELVHRQILPLRYEYQTVELPVDIAFLVLADATPSEKVPAPFNFPLRVNWEPCDDEPPAGGRDAAMSADAVREYITTVRRISPTFAAQNESEVQHVITEAFMDLTKSYPLWNNRDSLIHNNTFSAVTALVRAHSSTVGRTGIAMEDVKHVIALERSRAQRLAVHK